MKKFTLYPVCFILLLSSFPQKVMPIGGKVVWEKMDWNILKTEHFNVHFPAGYDALGKTAAIYLEEANILLSRKFRHNLTQVIPVFIYPSHGHFQSTNVLPISIDEGTGGFTERIKKRVVVPFMGSYDEFRHVLTHELVHAFQYDILLGGGFSGLFASQYSANPPLWLVEGMAEYFSVGWDETAEMTMRDAVISDTLPSIEMMTEYRVVSGFIFYKGGQSVMRFIDETWGEYKIGELLRDMRDQRSLEDAIKTNFGIPFKDFDSQWRRWVKRKFAQDIHKRIDGEEGILLSKHLDDRSLLNMHPSISPDGEKAVYISIRDFYPVIVSRNIKDLKNDPDYSITPIKPQEDDETILVEGGDNFRFHQLHFLKNRISFTPDSKNIFFSARSQGKDRLFLFNLEKKKIIKMISPPVDMVLNPRLSPNGTKAVFVGVVLGQPDIYMVDIESLEIKKITNDSFSEKDPALGHDNTLLLYSSNKNDKKNVESGDYSVYELNLITKKETRITRDKNKQINARYVPGSDSEKILFVSNHTGIHNAYIFDKKKNQTQQITNSATGIFEPGMDEKGKKIIFTMYRQQGFDIAVKSAPLNEGEFTTLSQAKPAYFPVTFPLYPGGLSNFKAEDYNPRLSPDFLFFMFTASSYGGFGFGGSVWFLSSDYSGDHMLGGYVDYISRREAANFNLTYGFLKKRVNVYAGAFSTSNYFSIFNLANITSFNNFLYFPTFISSSLKYGGYIAAEYPITPFLSATVQYEISRIEETYFWDFEIPQKNRRPDVYSNIQSLNFMVRQNNVLYSAIGPLKGYHIQWMVEQTMNVSGNDHVYNRNSIDARYYFLFFKRYIFATRAFIGTVNGPNQKYFPWQIGGFNTIRGYDFLSFRGIHTFFMNLELRFPFLDALFFGFPVPWALPGFSGVFFIDGGTAADSFSTWKGFDPENNRFKDLKMAYGLGARLVLFPGLIFKIDWGTPWTWSSSLPISRWQGNFSIGYEF